MDEFYSERPESREQAQNKSEDCKAFSPPLRVLVCGGRDFHDGDCVWATLSAIRGISVIIHGAASGADTQGMIWAQTMGRRHVPFAADWHKHGRAAGPIRNQRMIDEGKPDLVVAFPGGRGTADMIRRAKVAGIEVREVALPAPLREIA